MVGNQGWALISLGSAGDSESVQHVGGSSNNWHSQTWAKGWVVSVCQLLGVSLGHGVCAGMLSLTVLCTVLFC